MRPVFVLCMLPVLTAQHALHKEQLPPTLQQVPEKSPYNNSYKGDILISVSMPISKVIDLYGPGIRDKQYQIVNGEDAKIMKITPNKTQRVPENSPNQIPGKGFTYTKISMPISKVIKVYEINGEDLNKANIITRNTLYRHTLQYQKPIQPRPLYQKSLDQRRKTLRPGYQHALLQRQKNQRRVLTPGHLESLQRRNTLRSGYHHALLHRQKNKMTLNQRRVLSTRHQEYRRQRQKTLRARHIRKLYFRDKKCQKRPCQRLQTR